MGNITLETDIIMRENDKMCEKLFHDLGESLNNEITDTDRMDFLENESETRKLLIHQFDGKTYRELIDEKIMEYKK